MRAAALVGVGLVLLVCALLVSPGPAADETGTPEALYQECQALEAEIEAEDATVRDLEFRIERQEKALANHEYVREQNEALIERLEAWAEGE